MRTSIMNSVQMLLNEEQRETALRWKRIVISLFVIALIAFVSDGQVKDVKAYDQLGKPLKRDLRYIYGRYEIPVTNDGRFGFDPEYNVPGGGRWPRGTNDGYIFGAGIWIGAIIDDVKHVTVGYNPTNVQTEMVPGAPNTDPNDSKEIVFVNTDYPNANLPPWPRGVDDDGNPITISQMDSWAQCNDLDASKQFEAGTPIGVHLITETFSWSSSFRDVQDFAIIRYTVKNVNPDRKKWTNAYVGFAMDADIGDPTNDLTGCYPDLNLGFTYSASELTSLEKELAYPPGYVGIKFLDGPSRDPITGEANMTTFIRWAHELNPNTDEIRYNLLAKGTYDILDTEPADKRMLLSSGPFDLEYGDTVEFVVAIVFAWPEWYFDSSIKGQPEKYADRLKRVAVNAQWVYDNEYRFPQPPDLPRVTLEPDDRKMIIIWDETSEKSKELSIALPEHTDPYDFEGYRLWKSNSGAEGTFTLLGEWDIISYDDLGRPIGRNTGLKHSFIDTELINGKTYFYAVTAYDRGEFERGYYGELEYEVVPPLETGKVFDINLKAGSPNVLPSNFTTPGFLDYRMVSGDSLKVSFRTAPEFVIRDNVESRTFHIAFKDPPSIRIDLSEPYLGPDIFVVDVVAQDTVSITPNFPIGYPPSSLDSDIFNGLKLTFTGPNLIRNRIDSVYFSTPKQDVRILPETDFSDEYSTFQTTVLRTAPLGFFFEPYTYLIEFLTADQVNVYNMTTGEQLNFELRMLGKDYAVTSFERRVINISPAGDTTWTWIDVSGGFRRRLYSPSNGYKFYIPGVFIAIEDIGREIQPGDSLYIRLAGVSAPRFGDIFQFRVEGSTINYKTDLSVVKVVPNPYLVRSAWDLDNDYQRVQFINLPTECVIRVYTIAGDLIKTIHHNDPYPGGFTSHTRGTAYWNLQTENNQKVSTGVYVYYLTSPYGETIGRFAIIR
jgi:hypothetical protein